jgi:hypothetical protein
MKLEQVCEMEAGRKDKAFRDRLEGTVWGDKLRGSVTLSHHVRRESDGLTLRDAKGSVRTYDNAEVDFSLQGRTVATDAGGRELLAVLFSTTDPRYDWLNRAMCLLEGKFVAESLLYRARVFSCVSDLP